jgi:hypothetical protein
MRFTRIFIAAGALVVVAGLASSSESLTDLSAPPGLSLKLTPSVTSTVATTSPMTLSLSATLLGRPV